MKRMLPLLLLATAASAATYYWNGNVPTGSYTDPASWLVNGATPSTLDPLAIDSAAIFNQTATVTFPAASTLSFYQWVISDAGRTVILSIPSGTTVSCASSSFRNPFSCGSGVKAILAGGGTLDNGNKENYIDGGAELCLTGPGTTFQNANFWFRNAGSRFRIEDGAVASGGKFQNVATASTNVLDAATVTGVGDFKFMGADASLDVRNGATLSMASGGFSLESGGLLRIRGEGTTANVANTYMGGANPGEIRVEDGASYTSFSSTKVGAGSGAGQTLRFRGAGTTARIIGNGNNTASILVGGGDSPADNTVIVEDGAYMLITTNNPGYHPRGVVFGEENFGTQNKICARSRFIVRSGATVASEFPLWLCFAHDSEVVVSNATLTAGGSSRVCFNSASTSSNRIAAVDGGVLEIAGDIYLATGSGACGAELLCRDATVNVDYAIKAENTPASGIPSRIRIEGTNGVITAGSLYTGSATGSMVLSFGIPAGGRSDDGAYLVLVDPDYGIKNATAVLELDIDRAFARKVKGSATVDLISVPRRDNSRTRLETFAATATEADLRGCSLSIVDTGSAYVLRLASGGPDPTLLILL
ncbi:MAG: hypothetical protein ACOX5G_01545 [Kiritimatiellia bacterium]|jgi:hypothetical protein